MADNPYVNKVELADGTTLMDITDTTAEAADVAAGEVFYTASGERSVGTRSAGNARVWYGTSSTAAATQTKAATVDGYTEYQAGDVLYITFANSQTYNGMPQINVNGLGAKDVARSSAQNGYQYMWYQGETVMMVYDGTRFLAPKSQTAGTTYYGVTRLETTSGTSTSTNRAMTPNSLNLAITGLITDVPIYDANSKYAVGDIVRHSGNQWKCTTPITTPEAWNAAHWQALPALQTQIDSIFGMTVAGILAMDN